MPASPGSPVTGNPQPSPPNQNPAQDPVVITKPGVYLLKYSTGEIALVSWNGNTFSWGKLKAPTATITHAQWLAPNWSALSSLKGVAIGHFYQAFNLTIGQYRALIGIFDHSANIDPSQGAYGQAIIVDPGIKPGQSPKGFTSGNEADSAGINLPSVGSIFGVFATAGFWKGIGLVLAGAAILIFAGLEFKKMA